ncbi:sulfite reductase (NADPH) flavoprotein alpha-component [Methylohalomonas lacus]|uniref:Sulfite reductase [NADPH] flavoprotein alpha-component n=1 Tax=Methylohalomonas lacus TaxID=398773 RepID=A0AAE3HMG8_9GAMM|nr:assimilatory sulfite reductase (NADPH) flavoprotein subunit [Methylohalomonas lacus]MCS3903212.1 sulfite reductase (NADPH) flavoprotein alpha-component [Methylohalomonas lacus]
MNGAKLEPGTSPLTAEQLQQLNHLVQTLSPQQAAWVSGYLAGLQQSGSGAADTAAANAPTLTVLYGSETGNSEEVARQLGERATAQGFAVQIADMAEYKHNRLRQEKHLLAIVSTHGEGDPPEPAQEFFEFLSSKKAPRLDGLQFSVLALGDASYEHYCQAGKDLDSRLEALGGQRLQPRVDCDVDYDDPAENWINGALETLGEVSGEPAPAATEAAGTPSVLYTRKNPYPAAVLENIVLSGRGSAKEVRHVELSLADSGLKWEPGDALGIVPVNDPELVDALLAALAFDAETPVTSPRDEQVPLRQALLNDCELTTLTRPLIEQHAELAATDELKTLLGDDQREALKQYMYGHQLIDLVRDYPPAKASAQDFVSILRRLPPRLYSIASSWRANPDEVHLTVDTVRFEVNGEYRHGVTSTLLADRLAEDDTVSVYIDHNKNFKLPTDPDTPIIMIGPGTGVAPFRAFLQEREEAGASGRNWLFFGDQHFRCDFLYQTEWLRWRRAGLLNRIDVAFSRDQADKIYVQHRLREQARDVYDWIEAGAHVYVCGDAERMAPDVHQALVDIISEQGGLESTQAEGYLKQLQKNRRYQRDVY